MARINSARFDLKGAVDKLIHDYMLDCAEELYQVCDEVSKEAVSRLKKESKAAFRNSKTYHTGWMRTVEKGRLQRVYTIHGNKDTYPLAHLLEDGHKLWQGGHADGKVHIKTVNDWAEDEVVDRVITRLSEGIQ